MNPLVMDGRRRMTRRQLGVFDELSKDHEDRGKFTGDARKSPDFESESPELRRFREGFTGPDHCDIMAVPMLERCECGREMRVGDYVCWGRCFACVEPTLQKGET